jgi:hypothetical protein
VTRLVETGSVWLTGQDLSMLWPDRLGWRQDIGLSNESPDTPLPERVTTGEEPFLVIGAMAGG